MKVLKYSTIHKKTFHLCHLAQDIQKGIVMIIFLEIKVMAIK
jgi:hypothetical protein